MWGHNEPALGVQKRLLKSQYTYDNIFFLIRTSKLYSSLQNIVGIGSVLSSINLATTLK